MGAYHPVWREVILPFLNDQRGIDQLWCCTSLFHNHILQRVTDLICYARPTDIPVKKKGIYPSYINQMTGLRNLYVKFYPRIKEMWENKGTREQGPFTFDELYSRSIPLTITRFDSELSIHFKLFQYPPSLTNLNEFISTTILNWLARVPNLTLGIHVKAALLTLHNLSPDYIVTKESRAYPPAYLKYQYISEIHINDLTNLMAVLTSSFPNYDTRGLIARFTEGITNLKTNGADNQLLMRSWHQDTVEGLYRTIYQLLPNLRVLKEMDPIVPFIPASLKSYSMYTIPADQNYRIPYMHNVRVLNVPWTTISNHDLSSLTSLTELMLQGRQSGITPQVFKDLIAALPKNLTSFGTANMYYYSNAKQYWTPEVIRSLPRGLLQWTISGPQELKELHWREVPPQLKEIRNYGGGQVLFSASIAIILPSSLTVLSLLITEASYNTQMIASLLQHFNVLRSLFINIEINTERDVQWVLPATLEKFSVITRESRGDLNIGQLFSQITWTPVIRTITVIANNKSVNITGDWNLPPRLETLQLVNVDIFNLPHHWPIGLRLFKLHKNSFKIEKVGGSVTNVIWPDIERMKYYMPDPSWSSVVYEGIPEPHIATNLLLMKGQNGRPVVLSNNSLQYMTTMI